MTRTDDSWMQTYSGRAFWPLDPHVDDVDAADIAHALSNLCRFGGHTKRHYSVAEHCVLMSYAHSVCFEHKLWALLHDASEAYLVDLPRPIKRSMPSYVAAEAKVLAVICERFGIDAAEPACVKDADNRILLDERAVMLHSPPPRPWAAELERLEPLGVGVVGWPAHVAEREYLGRLHDLAWRVMTK